jgi:hypothetical protein
VAQRIESGDIGAAELFAERPVAEKSKTWLAAWNGSSDRA